MPKRGGATRGGDTGSGGERKKTRVERVGMDTLRAIIAEKDAEIAEKNAVIGQQAATLAQKDSALAQKDSALAQKDAVIVQ